MTKQMIIRVESSLKNKVSQLAKAEGKNLSELVRKRTAPDSTYTSIGAYIDTLWDRIGQNFTKKGISEIDIEEAIKQVRSKNA